MSFELFKKIIDEIAGRVYSIKFTGRGEPLMHKEFLHFMEYLKDKQFGEIAMITNGLLMTDEVMCGLIETQMDFVSFSIDGLKKQYEEIRRPGKYEQIYEIVKRLNHLKQEKKSRKPLIRIQSVMVKPEEEKEYLRLWEPISDDIFFLYFKDFSPSANNLQMQNYTCPVPFQRLIIHFDGTVPMCINDEYECSIMGDVNLQTVQEVWKGDRFRDARKVNENGARTVRYENCAHCCLTREGHGR